MLIDAVKFDFDDLPSWDSLVIFRNNRVVNVNWEGDFLLKEALEVKRSVKDLKRIYGERSKLYNFLSSKKVILNPASPLPNTFRRLILRPYESRKIEGLEDFSRHDLNGYYRNGPTHRDIIYCFNKIYRRIAEDWIIAYNKLNPDKETFLPDC